MQEKIMNAIESITIVENLPKQRSSKRYTLKDIKRLQRAKKMSVSQFLRPLEKAVDSTNKDMQKKKKQLKVSVYKRKNQILMNVIVDDKNFETDITSHDFCDIIHNVSDVKGLIIDSSI
jgi:hypothetical protein